nr:tumor necrosis factor ligand superfamily member 14 [Pelodiscus sinensis]|eukprot:XP_025041274.1 tumor necrosis factor ligand superfamily member 14 [Pelodiscus sinensis]
MGEGVVYPSVFVVDSQQHGVPFVPPMRGRRRACRHGQVFLAALVSLALAGVATEGYFLFRFQRELAKAASQVGGEAGPVSEKSIQDRKHNAEKPAAHVIGAAFTTTTNSSLQWEPSKDLAFLHDVEYQAGALVCVKPGYYYIYSKLQLRVQSCSQQGQNSFLIHSIYKKTPRYPEEMKLMENLVSYCDRKDAGFWQDGSFLGGLFHLEEKDRVYVNASQRQVVSYFGIFMI